MARNRDVAREVEAIRLRAEGLTQSEVSSQLGVSPRTVRRWEERWKRGDIALGDVEIALWAGYQQEIRAHRRLRYLQTLARTARAQAELAVAKRGG